MKIETEHLSYEHGIVSIVQDDTDNIDCGLIRDSGIDSCVWPAQIGHEPKWFALETDSLVITVMDTIERLTFEDRNYRNQVNEDYLKAKGAK